MAFVFSPGALKPIFGKKFNSIGSLQIDVTVRETHNQAVTVTSKAVESGATISDNAIVEDAEISISGIMTDELFESWADKYEALDKVLREREPFDVVTSLKVYEDMVFTRLTIDRDVSTTGALFFDADLKQVDIIESQTRQVPASATKEPRQQAPKVDRGNTRPQEPSATEAESSNERKRTSVLGGLVL